MNLQDTLTRRFLRHLVATPIGRAHILNTVADAESNGESTIFESALSHVDDPELARLIRRHAADEVDHAKLFEQRRDAQGVDVGSPPEHLRIIKRLDEKLGGFFARGVKNRRDVMDAYLLLQVVEERAITQFPMMAEAFRPLDSETADTFVAVGADEERHLKYCLAISKRYAPTEAIRQRTLREMRALEALCFKENSDAGFAWVMSRKYTELSPAEAFGWNTLSKFSRSTVGRLIPPPQTAFAYAA